MADALASGASVLRDVGVQVPLRPQSAVLRTATSKAANSKELVAFVFWAVWVLRNIVSTGPETSIVESPLFARGLAAIEQCGRSRLAAK
jgi:hypothetical protein